MNAILLAVAAAGSAIAASPERTLGEQEAHLRRLLSAHEYAVDRETLEKVGPQVEKLLIELAGHPEERPTLRQRATSALSVFPSPRTREYLLSQLWERRLVGNPTGTLLRREAMRSLATGFGEEVVDVLSALRDDPDPQIREGCARALGLTGSDLAERALDAWLPNEKELFVRTAIDESLARIRERRPAGPPAKETP